MLSFVSNLVCTWKAKKLFLQLIKITIIRTDILRGFWSPAFKLHVLKNTHEQTTKPGVELIKSIYSVE